MKTIEKKMISSLEDYKRRAEKHGKISGKI